MTSGVSRLSGRRILITGARGFIGSRLLGRLRGCGADLHAVGREAASVTERDVRWWRADLAETDATRAIVSSIRPDLIFHLAIRWYAAPYSEERASGSAERRPVEVDGRKT